MNRDSRNASHDAGRFITFEGGEGSGKSTQIKLLTRRLGQTGVDVLMTREPGGSPGAEAIRHVILSGAAKPFGADVEAMLFAAARQDHVARMIRPALDAGRWVLCDRFLDSTQVYQGTLGKVGTRTLNALERVAVGATRPDLTLILDVPAEIGLARAAFRRAESSPDRFEGEELAFHQQLRDAYRELPQRHPERCMLVDAAGDPEKVADAIWRIVAARFPALNRAPERARALA